MTISKITTSISEYAQYLTDNPSVSVIDESYILTDEPLVYHSNRYVCRRDGTLEFKVYVSKKVSNFDIDALLEKFMDYGNPFLDVVVDYDNLVEYAILLEPTTQLNS
jgi:hypothetical protein